jgi:hypothetical protein
MGNTVGMGGSSMGGSDSETVIATIMGTSSATTNVIMLLWE